MTDREMAPTAEGDPPMAPIDDAGHARTEADSAPDPPGPEQARSAFVRVVASPAFRLAMLVVLVGGAAAVVIVVGLPDRSLIEEWIAARGALAPAVYIAAYAGLTVLMAPGAVLTIVGGALFGTLAGTLLTIVGATAGATGAYLLARRLGRDQVEILAGRRLQKADAWLEERGFWALLVLRLIPLVPFNALNYLAGLTAIRRVHYVAATALGIIPGAFAFTLLGATADRPGSAPFLAAVGLVIVLAVGGGLIARRMRDPSES